MKFFLSFLLPLLFLPQLSLGQEGNNKVDYPLNFAVVTDTHIGKNKTSEGLREIVNSINTDSNIEFVLHAGDISDFGTDDELEEAKFLLDKLTVPYLIVPGNHDTGWSSSGSLIYDKLWEKQNFVKDIQGVRFIGFSTGPYGRMSRGYVPLEQLKWLDSLVKITPSKQPVIFLTHYPLDKGLSNYEKVIDIMHKMRTIAVFSGHVHVNKVVDYEGIPGIMTRTAQMRNSTLAYNIVKLTRDSLLVKQAEVGKPAQSNWASLEVPDEIIRRKDTSNTALRKPIPEEYQDVELLWTFQDDANIVSTPVEWKGNILFGNLSGKFKSINPENDKVNWSFDAGEAIYSSPDISGNNVVFASADSTVYNLDASTGELLWKYRTEAPVLASPVIEGDRVFIGSSDPAFRSLDLKSGEQVWTFNEIEGFPASKPAVGDELVIFGTWGKTIYALNKKDGSLAWKWKNEDYSRYYSPAMVVPVIQNNKVYIVAPDEKLREFDLETGEQTFVTDKFRVRESLGGAAEKDILLAKTMQDSIVAWSTKKDKPELIFNIDGGFGNDFSASMPVFLEDIAVFGTTFGRVYAVDLKSKKVKWAYQASEDMINTVRPLKGNKVLATSVDGKIVILKGGDFSG